MTAAIRTGVAPSAWLEDARALITCAELLHEADLRRRR